MIILLLLFVSSEEDNIENLAYNVSFESDEFAVASASPPSPSPEISATPDSQTLPITSPPSPSPELSATSDSRPLTITSPSNSIPSPTPDDWVPDDDDEEDPLSDLVSKLIFVLLVLVMLTLISVMGICCYRRLKRTRAAAEEERVDEPLLVTAEVF
jgi:hypothetical protein